MDPPGSASDRTPGERWAPVLLVAMAITFPELLTGSTPFLTILLNPLAVAGLVGLYGAGVVAIREYRVRWRAGWPSVLLLGASYGVLEEGFATRTFFASAKLVGVQGSYGHFDGINWVWAVQLSTFHAVFSIVLPILLLDAAFPALRERPFLSRRGGWTVVAILGVAATLFAVLLNPQVRPAVAPMALVGGLGGLLVFAGVRSRAWRLGTPRGTRRRPGRLVALGAAWTSTFFAINWVGPVVVPIPALLVALEVAMGALFLWLAMQAYGPAWDPGATVALAAGLLSFLLLFASILEVYGDWGVGIAVAGVIALLLWVHRRSSREGRESRAPAPPEPPLPTGPVQGPV